MSDVTVSVVGLGRVARSHIDGIRQWPGRCELGPVIDIQEDRAKAFAREYDVPYYTSTEAAYEDADIDAVVVCVPHHLHAPLTIEACEAGKHVLVEKVMATSLSDAEEMIRAADSAGVNLMVGQTRRFFPTLREAYRRRDEIGDITNLLYTFACHFDVDTAPEWWQSEEQTGGLVYPMLGAHSIDYTLWMLDDRKPVSVYAAGASNNPDFEGDDDATLVIKFDDGTHATNYLSINNEQVKHQGLVVGTDGSIYWDQTGDHSGDLVGVASTDLALNGDPITADGETHNFAYQMREFVDSIREEREPEPAGSDILPQIEIIEAARRSVKTGAEVDL